MICPLTPEEVIAMNNLPAVPVRGKQALEVGTLLNELCAGMGGGAVPARTLFVALSWTPVTVDPTIFFTTISAALAQAATMSPTALSPVAIVIYPGTYADPLTLVSNVHLISTGRRSAVITGPITWVAGAGINASQAALREEVDLVLIACLGSVSIDTTAKTGGPGVLDARDSAFRAGVTYLARPGKIDFWQVWNAITFGGLNSFDNTNVNYFSSSIESLAFTGNAEIDVRACEIFGTITTSGTAIGAIEASQINTGPVTIGAGTFVDFTGSRFTPIVLITVAGAADLRMAEYDSNASLAGAGTIDRSIWRTAVGPTAVGPNPVPIFPSLPNVSYDVSVTQTAGPVGFPPLVIGKAPGGFLLVDAIGGRVFDVTVLKE